MVILPASVTYVTHVGNILILRGDITILPPDRETASYEFLSQLVAEYLLVNAPGVDVSAALSVLPYTQSTRCPLSPPVRQDSYSSH